VVIFIVGLFLDIWLNLGGGLAVVLFIVLLVTTVPFSLAWAYGDTLFVSLGLKQGKELSAIYKTVGLYTVFVSIPFSVAVGILVAFSSVPITNFTNFIQIIFSTTVLLTILALLNWVASIIYNRIYLLHKKVAK